MSRDEKKLISGIIGGIVVVIIVIIALTMPFFGNTHSPNTIFDRANYDMKSVTSDNNTLQSSGILNYQLTPPEYNNSVWSNFVITPPGNSITGLISDHGVYISHIGGYTVYENETYANYSLSLISGLTGNSLRQTLVLNNTKNYLQKFSFSYQLFTAQDGNITLYNETTSGPNSQNITIAPHIHGMTESYTFQYSSHLGIKFPLVSNTTVSWSQLSGLMNGGEITFSNHGTEVDINFAEVSIPPGASLNLGTITTSD